MKNFILAPSIKTAYFSPTILVIFVDFAMFFLLLVKVRFATSKTVLVSSIKTTVYELPQKMMNNFGLTKLSILGNY